MVKQYENNGLSAERIRNIAEEIFNSFHWESTPQGPMYWNRVFNDLCDIARKVTEQQKPCPTCGQERKQ